MDVVRVRANRRAADEQDLRSGEGLVHTCTCISLSQGVPRQLIRNTGRTDEGYVGKEAFSYVYLVGSGACLSLMAVCDLPSVAAHKRKEGRTIASVDVRDFLDYTRRYTTFRDYPRQVGPGTCNTYLM